MWLKAFHSFHVGEQISDGCGCHYWFSGGPTMTSCDIYVTISGAGDAAGYWHDFSIAAAEYRAVWSSKQRHRLSMIFSVTSAKCLVVWFSQWKCQLWVFSALAAEHWAVRSPWLRHRLSAFTAFGTERWTVWSWWQTHQPWVFSAFLPEAPHMWDLNHLPNFIGWLSCPRRCLSPVSIFLIHWLSSGSLDISVSNTLCLRWQDMYLLALLSKTSSAHMFILWNSECQIIHKVIELCMLHTIMQDFDLRLNMPQ